jgi:Carbohydrate-binding family 9
METIVARVDDFELDGTGTVPAWESADWLTIQPVVGPSTAATRAKILYSTTGVYCLFDCEDNLLYCTALKDNDDLWEEDVVEAFFWPDESHPLYLEYELSPLGMELPLLVPNNAGTFMGWSPWHYTGARRARRATSIRGGNKTSMASITGWSAEFFIPFALMSGLKNVPPGSGARWRANFYRIDHDKTDKTYFAWSPIVSSFHETGKYGTIVFA